MMSNVKVAAAEYRAKGIGICRIREGEKRPTDGEWTMRSAEPDEFKPGDSIGLLCGWLSDGGKTGRHLACVDLDNAEAITKADEILPPTEAIEGRPGNLRQRLRESGDQPGRGGWAEDQAVRGRPRLPGQRGANCRPAQSRAGGRAAFVGVGARHQQSGGSPV